MTQFAKPIAQRPQSWLAQLKAQANATAAGGTEYIVEYPGRKAGETMPESERGNTVAILGDISHDHAGTSTGLSGWGVAVKRLDGNWIQLGGPGTLYGPYEAFSTNMPAAGEEHTVEVEHHMPTTPIAVFGGVKDGFFASCMGWRWTATSTHIAITFHTLVTQGKVEAYLHFMAL